MQRNQQLRAQHEQREEQQQHDLEHQLAGSQNQIHELTRRLEATQSESNALRQETTLLRQRAQTLTTAHEEMREKLALSADGLSESMREARYCWKRYEKEDPMSFLRVRGISTKDRKRSRSRVRLPLGSLGAVMVFVRMVVIFLTHPDASSSQ